MSGRVGAEDVRSIKMTVVGDRTVGKTALLLSYTTGSYSPRGFIKPMVDCNKNLNIDGYKFSVSLWDTVGQEEYKKWRMSSYPKTDCFIICYAVDQRSSFANVETIWMPQLKLHCPTASIVLVGTKSDLITPENPRCVSEEEGQKLKCKIKANAFILCSAKTNTNVDEIFMEAVRAAAILGQKEQVAVKSVPAVVMEQGKNKRCTLL